MEPTESFKSKPAPKRKPRKVEPVAKAEKVIKDPPKKAVVEPVYTDDPIVIDSVDKKSGFKPVQPSKNATRSGVGTRTYG